MTKIIALVPMRHHSQRVPGKNYRQLAGRPLYHYILDTLSACPEIHQIVVDTDSPDIKSGIQVYYPDITILKRPEHLRGDAVPMNEILIHDTAQIKADFYLQTHSTNPLLQTQTVSSAVAALLDVYPAYDSLFSVTRRQIRLWDQLGRAINHNPDILLQTQDLPPIYEENSCLYIFTRQTLVSRHNRLGARPLMFEIETQEALDIDDEIDFQICELLVRKNLEA